VYLALDPVGSGDIGWYQFALPSLANDTPADVLPVAAKGDGDGGPCEGGQGDKKEHHRALVEQIRGVDARQFG
jgi:hypothetical protein